MSNYQTPGVYVEEISKFPPSVAQVATAIPAFFGRTEIGEANKPTRISSMIEFEAIFGGPENKKYTVAIKQESTKNSDKPVLVPTVKEPNEENPYLNCILHPCMQLYFANGGGPCYIVSIGGFSVLSNSAPFTEALATLEKVDEPTLIVMPEAQQLADYGNSIVTAVLTQCAKLKDRFGIFDFDYDKDKVEVFRERLGMNNLKYGAAYTPFLNTTIPYAYDDEEITLDWKEGASVKLSGPQTARLKTEEAEQEAEKVKKAFIEKLEAFQKVYKVNKTNLNSTSASKKQEKESAEKAVNTALQELKEAKAALDKLPEVKSEADYQSNCTKLDAELAKIEKVGSDINLVSDNDPVIYSNADTAATALSALLESTKDAGSSKKQEGSTQTFPKLSDLKDKATLLYNQIKKLLDSQRITLPPSAAVAGIYAAVDRQRGVWKAPANVSVASVIGPKYMVNNEEQSGLNVDPTTGKSINVIRSFAGKGSIVWGARTLDGNSNEWRYVNVRRLFITIEESVQKATAFAIFEPNDATTWLKVKAMIDSYLYGLWQQGALAGTKPEDAYFVHVGLGKTMTADDILNGYMNVEIGIAAVRPAEFIVLKFSHKLQES